MKKLTAILFLLILTFNFCGYRLIISLLENKADSNLEASIDNKDYDESELVEMRTSLNMPYQDRHTEFERHYGEITIDGQVYNYVERKIDGNVLVLKCIANTQKQQLKEKADDITKANSGQDQQNNNKKQTGSFIKLFSGDYDYKNQSYALSAFNRIIALYNSFSSTALNDVLIKTPHQPPKSA
ncbi:MAG: hypothetical protein ABJA79_11685 [Parafilimonas sp.]